MADVPPYPLYNSTFSTYRASPFYHGPSDLLDEHNLRVLARRFRDRIQGDTLRGVQVSLGASDNGLTNSKLEECTFELLGDEPTWRAKHRPCEDSELDRTDLSSVKVFEDSIRGIHVKLQYERTTHTALLLRDPTTECLMPGFTSLPLLMVRMPAALREVFLDFLSTNFDAKISPMKLRSPFLTSSLEGFLKRIDLKEHPENSDLLGNDLRLQLSFPPATLALKGLDITIAKDDVQGFVSRGKMILQSQQTAAKNLSRSAVSGPFITALSVYLNEHLALSLSHPEIVISKVVCGPMALGNDGKIKLFPPRFASTSDDSMSSLEPSVSELAMNDFYLALLREADSGPLSAAVKSRSLIDGGNGKRAPDMPESSSMSSKSKKFKLANAEEALEKEELDDDDDDDVVFVGAKQRHTSVLSDREPPPPYEMHDFGRPAVVR